MDLSEYEIEGIKEYERIFKILDEIKFHQWEIKRHFRDGKLFISTHPSDDLKIEYQWPVEVDMTQEEVFNLVLNAIYKTTQILIKQAIYNSLSCDPFSITPNTNPTKVYKPNGPLIMLSQ